MRLSDARLRCRQMKLFYLNHRLPLWPNEVAAPRSLEPIVRLYVSSQKMRPISNPRSRPHKNPAPKIF
jgi:hypothetical protein